ncbi:MAG: carbon-nitrogen family hydrolase [Cyanobacteria bacterium RUI128]|nr:carbon-nitrogen family hydrolase [Cyanobacteria bacterium RUI128]
MEKINILAVQMESVIGNKHKNFEKINNLVQNNITSKTDIVILPELWSVGWACDRFQESAEEFRESETVNFLSELAKKYVVNILGGSFVRKEGDKLYNTCPVLNRKGEMVGHYDKNHLFSYYDDTENTYITEGENPVMINLDGVKIGLTICYDIRFPEIYRVYRKAGADLLVNMAAWPLSRKIHWDSLTCARAVENQTYMVALTQTGTLPTGAKNLGHSLIYDYSGNIMDEIDTKEGAIKAEIDLPPMYDFRDKCTVLKDIHDKYEVNSL